MMWCASSGDAEGERIVSLSPVDSSCSQGGTACAHPHRGYVGETACDCVGLRTGGVGVVVSRHRL